MDLKMIFADALHEQVVPHWNKEELYTLIETPKFSHMGDAAFPCFGLAKELKKAPQAIAAEFAGKIGSPYFASVEAAGPYVNVKFDPVKAGKQIISTILDQQQEYGTQSFGNDRTVVLDLSSPISPSLSPWGISVPQLSETPLPASVKNADLIRSKLTMSGIGAPSSVS